MEISTVICWGFTYTLKLVAFLVGRDLCPLTLRSERRLYLIEDLIEDLPNFRKYDEIL